MPTNNNDDDHPWSNNSNDDHPWNTSNTRELEEEGWRSSHPKVVWVEYDVKSNQ
jgi:hypothetical protein